MRKKLTNLVNKGHTEIRPWINSIINHLYWCAADSENSSPEMIVARWKSVCNHIVNKHKGHDDPLFPQCLHDPRSETDDKKSYLDPGIYCDVPIKSMNIYIYIYIYI